MIPQIKELNFPRYATLLSATVDKVFMGDSTITTQIRIADDIIPDFSFDWLVNYSGAKYIMPKRIPQAAIDNQSVNTTVDLVFQHWAEYQLKRWFFFTVQAIDAGTAYPDKYIASVTLNLKDFCDLFNQVLDYYYHGKILLSLNPQWAYDIEPKKIDISNTRVWDVLTKLYEVFAVHWIIEPGSDNTDVSGEESYIIKVGYPVNEIDHIFQAGFDGGLLKLERQVQDDGIYNMLLGLGGEKNLPLRYFKKHDENNAGFSPDPDWIPELENIYFQRLHGATFRSYIQGWRAAHIEEYRAAYPDEEWELTVTEAAAAYAPWAWMRGYTDQTFDPVKFVADEFDTSANGYGVVAGSSIDKYGELMNGLADDEEIYPTIQGVELPDIGRIDEAIAVLPVTSDDIESSAKNDAVIHNVEGAKGTVLMEGGVRLTLRFDGPVFTVGDGKSGNFDIGPQTITLIKEDGAREPNAMVVVENAITTIINTTTNETISASGIPAGHYRYHVQLDLYNTSDKKFNVTVAYEKPTLTEATLQPEWSNTWGIWVKNIFQTAKQNIEDNGKWRLETDAEYADRVWRPILGDRAGGEAKVMFSDGMLALSEDYEFVITSTPRYDARRWKWTTVSPDGSVTNHEYTSEWFIPLGKSDADFEATGKYIPNVQQNAKPGDHFFFTGIDMPHVYVTEAEKRLDNSKKDKLADTKEIKPTWVVGLDRVRISNNGIEAGALINKLHPGDSFTIFDRRLIPGSAQEKLYIQSMKITFREAKSDDAALCPDVEVVLNDKYETTANPISTISGEISAIQKQIGSISNIEQIVRAIGDKLYLRKDGFPDMSLSPTQFFSLLTSGDFRNGMIGGEGWGFFKDGNGNWVLETDRLNIRQEMQVNTLVINQVEGRGGMSVDTAAYLEITDVVKTDAGYTCYFDQKEGTIANLFHVDDVAYCSRFTPENGSLKYYKRRVMEVAQNYVVLTKGYWVGNPSTGEIDTGVDGSGVPEKGDVVIQYGNYTDKERQYVKVRDVIGGGYERYIEGLDSVAAKGREYFFIGRQSGSYGNKPRWYVGIPESNIEFREGEFNLNGVKLSVTSRIGDKPIDEYIAGEIENTEIGTQNLLLDSELRSLRRWSCWPADHVQLDTSFTYNGHNTVRIRCLNLQEQLYAGILQSFTQNKYLACNPGEWFTVSVSVYCNNKSTVDDGVWIEPQFLKADTSVIVVGRSNITPTANGKWQRFSFKVQAPATAVSVSFYSYVGLNGEVWLAEPMLQRGVVATDWAKSPHDIDYITEALKEDTTIDGGLIQTSRVALGYTDESGNRVTTAGTNGISNPGDPGGGLAIFAGGDGLADDNATFAIRFDGTGYAANKTLKFLQDALHVGENGEIRLTKEGLFLMEGENIRLQITNKPVEIDPDRLATPVIEITDGRVVQGQCYPDVPSAIFTDIPPTTIEAVKQNELISVTIRASLDRTWIGSPYPFPTMQVAMINLDDDTVMASGSMQFATNAGATSVEIPLIATNSTTAYGTLAKVVIQYTIISGGVPSTYDPVNCRLMLNVQGTRSTEANSQNLIGNNGFYSIWDNAALGINNDVFVARVGYRAIRITNNAIEIDRGDGWVEL